MRSNGCSKTLEIIPAICIHGHGRKSLDETRTYTPKGDVLDRTHGGGDGESVVGHGGNEESVSQRATALHLSSSKLAVQLFKPRR